MSAHPDKPKPPITLTIDIGGTGLKMLALDAAGTALGERSRIPTPRPATPDAVISALDGMVRDQPAFDRVAAGFPGVVVAGVVRTAPNLDGEWSGVALADELARRFGKPTRVANDADVQGLADIKSEGVEMVLTLGTGLGSALFLEGRLVPNLELGHHPFHGGKTYEDWVSNKALKKIGRKRWRRRVREVIEQIPPIWNPRAIYLGGGNSRLLRPGDLPAGVEICSNTAGLLGGLRLWTD